MELIEALGSELLVHFDSDARRVRPAGKAKVVDDAELPEAEVSARDSWIARLPPSAQVRSSETARFALDVAQLHFFDPATGLAIR